MLRLPFLVTSLLLVTASWAGSQVNTLAFTPPATYTDGSQLPASAIQAYAVECLVTATGSSSTTPCQSDVTSLPGTAAGGQVTVSGLPAIGGKVCFRLRTQAGGVLSDPSNEACKTFAATRPGAPSNLTVTVTVEVQLPAK